MKSLIKSYSELKAEGKKISLLKANRNINEKNVTKKVSSLEKVGNLIPLIIVEAEKVVKQGFEIVDFETGNEIQESEIKDYFTILDGQHRMQAHLEILEKKPDFDKPLKFHIVEIGNKKITQVLSEINNQVVKWDGRDFSKMADVETNGEYRLITEINKLTERGYSLESANKWLTFKNDVTSTILSKLVSGETLSEKMEEKINNVSGIERGLNILESAKKTLSEVVLKTRVIVDWVGRKYDNTDDSEKGTFQSDMCRFFEGLKKKQSEAIEKAKGKRGVQTKEDVIFKLLNQYYNEFMTQQKEAA